MNDDLKDIPDADRLLPLPGIPAWLVVALFIAIVLAVVILVTWCRHRAITAKFRHRGAAYRLAAAALETWHANPAEIPLPQLAAGISLILRSYIESATGDPAIFETREELGARDGAMQQLDEATRSGMMAYLMELSELEYGPHAEGNRDDLLAKASTLLEQARQALEP